VTIRIVILRFGSIWQTLQIVTCHYCNPAMWSATTVISLTSPFGRVHSCGIVHCDIAPKNILVSLEAVWLAVFGDVIQAPKMGNKAAHSPVSMTSLNHQEPEMEADQSPC
jgi:tRNA A-37 threonylcarbamoyl transferase component Bud32